MPSKKKNQQAAVLFNVTIQRPVTAPMLSNYLEMMLYSLSDIYKGDRNGPVSYTHPLATVLRRLYNDYSVEFEEIGNVCAPTESELATLTELWPQNAGPAWTEFLDNLEDFNGDEEFPWDLFPKANRKAMVDRVSQMYLAKLQVRLNEELEEEKRQEEEDRRAAAERAKAPIDKAISTLQAAGYTVTPPVKPVKTPAKKKAPR